MAMSQQGKNISVVKTFYNDSQMTDMNSLANALMSKPTELSPIITHLAGKDDKRFPLSFLTEGVGNVKSMDRLEYEYRVSTHKRKTRPVATTNSGGNLGQAGGTFTLEFPDKWFVFPYVLVNSAGELARIMKEPEAAAGTGNWKYTLQLVNPSTSATLSSGFTAGDLWAQLYAPVGVDFSRGNEEYQHMLNFKEECEMFYWYGQKTYNSDGHTFMKDENGQPVIVGPGLLEQIVNKDSYSTMTETKIKNIIGDLFYGMTDANKKQVTLYTGTGGMREFDEALKNHFTTAAGSWKVGGENRFITGSGRSLGLSGYFTSYEHVDGHTVNVVKLPLFDHGPVAQAAGKHPVTGYSLESYRMVFVDQSNYDGQANLQMLSKKGREMMRWCVAGSVVPRGFDGGSARASDVDGASVHMLKTAGIILKRFDTSLDITCTAS